MLEMLDVNPEKEQVEIEFDEASTDKIAELAEKLQTGARGLRTICERFMTQIIYDISSEKNLSKITITPEVVEGTAKPIYYYNVSRTSHELMPLTSLPPRGTSPYTDEGERANGKGY